MPCPWHADQSPRTDDFGDGALTVNCASRSSMIYTPFVWDTNVAATAICGRIDVRQGYCRLLWFYRKGALTSVQQYRAPLSMRNSRML